MPSGADPINDDEIVYRKIPLSMGWYDEQTKKVSPEAFKPRVDDLTGISFDRAILRSITDAAQGQKNKKYYVAKLRAGDLKAKGIELDPKPIPGNAAHAESPSINYANRKEGASRQIMASLALCVLSVEGPYETCV